MSRPRIPHDELLADLRRVAATVRRLGYEHYNRLGRYNASTMQRSFGSWTHALELAGIKRPGNPGGNVPVPDAVLLQDIQRVIQMTGSTALTAYKAHGRHDGQRVRNRFGSWRQAVEAAGHQYVHPNHNPDSLHPHELDLALAEHRALKRPPRQPRRCLKCDRHFQSLGPQNRLCTGCSASNAHVGIAC